MIIIINFLLAFLLNAFSAQAHPSRGVTVRGDLPDGYTRVNVTWKGRIAPGSPPISISGLSLKDIANQINITMSGTFSWSTTADSNGITSSVTTINARDMSNSIPNDKDSINCHVGGNGVVSSYAVLDSINFLHGTHGDCEVPRGPRACGMMACESHAGVWFCNDNDFEISQPCSIIGDYAADIERACSFNASPPPGWYTPVCHGQEFDTDNFNVVVGFTNDFC